MEKMLPKKNPLRAAQAAAIGFGLGFAIQGLATGMLRMTRARLPLSALTAFFLIDLVVSSLLIGACGGAVLGYSLHPRRTGLFALLCAGGYLVASFLTSTDFWILFGIDIEQMDWVTALLYVAPLIQGGLMAVLLGKALHLQKHTPILILAGALSFEIGWLANRLLLIAIAAAYQGLGYSFPPISEFQFALTSLVSAALNGIIAGGLFGAAVGTLAPDLPEKRLGANDSAEISA